MNNLDWINNLPEDQLMVLFCSLFQFKMSDTLLRRGFSEDYEKLMEGMIEKLQKKLGENVWKNIRRKRK